MFTLYHAVAFSHYNYGVLLREMEHNIKRCQNDFVLLRENIHPYN